MSINEKNSLNDKTSKVKEVLSEKLDLDGYYVRQEIIERFNIDELDFENIAFCYSRHEAIEKAQFITGALETATEMADTLRGCVESIRAQQQFADAVWGAESVWAEKYTYTDLETGQQEPVMDTEVMNSSLIHSSEYNPVASYVLAQESFRGLARQIANDENSLLGLALMDLVDDKYAELLGAEPYPDKMPQELSRKHFGIL